MRRSEAKASEPRARERWAQHGDILRRAILLTYVLGAIINGTTHFLWLLGDSWYLFGPTMLPGAFWTAMVMGMLWPLKVALMLSV